MNEPQLDQGIQQNITRVKKDATSLKEDGLKQVKKVGEDMDHTREDVAARVNSGMDQLNSEYEKVKGDAQKTVAHATNTLKKNVGTGLTQYNSKAEEVAKKLPGGIGEKAGKYPWIAITFALLTGFLLRGLLMPGRIYRK